MLGNLLKKVFKMTTIANDLTQIYTEVLKSDQSSSTIIEDFGERMNANFDKLLCYATDFDLSESKSREVYLMMIHGLQ
jgi:hypothetical protein